MKNLKEVAEKIKQAKKIVLYSDSDIDGVSSALIAKKTIEEIGKETVDYFTHKENRGYGLSEKSVDVLSHQAPATLILMDCGITNFKGVLRAKEKGFEVIIIDHHKPHQNLPEADLIVCPKLYDDDFKERPNAGIILELSNLLLGQYRADFSEYAALAILGDMMIKEGPNKKVLDFATENFPITDGVSVLSKKITEESPIASLQKIASILNITEMISYIPEAFTYFLTNNKEEISQKLINQYQERKRKVSEIEKEILEQKSEEEIIFVGRKDWSSLLLGKIASRIVLKTNKPVFLYKDKGEVCQGTVRVPKGVDAVEVMKKSEKILKDYGGHPLAAGFTLESGHIEEFKKNLINYFK